MEKRTVFEDFADFSQALEQDLVADGKYHFSEGTILVEGELVSFDFTDKALLELVLLGLLDGDNHTLH